MGEFQFNGTRASARREISGGLLAFGDETPSVDPVKAFERWMRNRKDPKGNRKFTDAKIRRRVDAFQSCRKIFRDAKISDVPLELVDDPDVLQKIESAFLSCPEYRRQTEKFRNRLVAAFHVYVAYRNATRASAESEGRLLPLNGDFQEFANAVPVRYKIGGTADRRVETWPDLLVQIVEHELALKNPVLQAFYNVPLIPSFQPFFMKNRPSSVDCRHLSTGYWINVDWSTPMMIRSVVVFSRCCGYSDDDICIWIKDIVEKTSEVETESLFIMEQEEPSVDESIDLNWTSKDLSDFEETDDEASEDAPEWTETVDEGEAPESLLVEQSFGQDDEPDPELESDDEEAEKEQLEEDFGSDEDESEEELSVAEATCEQDDEDIVQWYPYNHKYYAFSGTVPEVCRIGEGEDNISSESWKGLLIKIVNREIKQKKPEIKLLEKQPLPSFRSGRPFFFSDEIEGQTCRVVANGLKIYLDDDIPQMIKIIVEFCRFVGYDDTEIVLRGRKTQMSTDLVQATVDRTESVDCPKSLSCRIGSRQVTAKNITWADFLCLLIEDEIKARNRKIKVLSKRPLHSSHTNEPFFQKEKPKVRSCRLLSNGFWIKLDYSDYRLVQIIRDFCRISGDSSYLEMTESRHFTEVPEERRNRKGFLCHLKLRRRLRVGEDNDDPNRNDIKDIGEWCDMDIWGDGDWVD